MDKDNYVQISKPRATFHRVFSTFPKGYIYKENNGFYSIFCYNSAYIIVV